MAEDKAQAVRPTGTPLAAVPLASTERRSSDYKQVGRRPEGRPKTWPVAKLTRVKWPIAEIGDIDSAVGRTHRRCQGALLAATGFAWRPLGHRPRRGRPGR